jgi:hypothetical protein
MSKFTSISTSHNSAHIEEPIIIYETGTTRRIFIADINDIKTSSNETVSGTIIHQRKGRNDEWEELESLNLNSLRAGEGIKLHFRSAPLRKLFEGLQELYRISEGGVYLGERELVVGDAERFIEVPENRKLFIQKLLEQDYGLEIWNELIDSNPDLVTRLSRAKIQHERNVALSEFEENIIKNQLDEAYWQQFFQKNLWIFGYGLNYCFLSQLATQPHYGEVKYTGKGAQRGDFLLTSNAAVKYTVLVEIKKPSTKLLTWRNGQVVEYRNGVCLIGSELAGGVAQLQVNCKTWQRNALDPDNVEELNKSNIRTVQPKGILIIGNTGELVDRAQTETFELFRRNMFNPEIVTFDELLERARFIVVNDEENKVQKSDVEENEF